MTTWFVTILTMYFARGFLYSSWSSRGPEVQERLGISIGDMGILATLFAAGAILGVLLTGRIVSHRGSRVVAIATIAGMPAAMALAILGVVAGSFPLTAIAIFLYGLPYGAADFVSSVESAEFDRASSKSRLPLIHGGFSLGVFAAASLTSFLIFAKVPLELQVGATLVIVGAFSVYRVWGLPAHHGKPTHEVTHADSVRPKLTTAARRRVTTISTIAFAFVLAEGAASIFIPLALVAAGRTHSEAALAFTFFSFGMALARFVGGWVVDRIGRKNVVFFSAVTAATGVALFAMSPFGSFEYVGALLWGIGNSVPIAMAVSAVTDNPKTANRSQSTLWTWVYVGNLAVGPLLGGAGILVGPFAAFTIPVAFLIYSAVVSPATKRDPELEPA
jgi:MFS family permease